MAQAKYIIPSDDGNLKVEAVSDLQISSCKVVKYADVTGTALNPDPTWSSGTMYVGFYRNGTLASITYKKSDGTTGSAFITSSQLAVIFAYTKMEPAGETLYIGFNAGTTENDALSNIRNNLGNTILYSGLLVDAAEAGIAEIDNSWEVTPSTDTSDPLNMDPRGGAYADTMPFGGGDDITLSDIEAPYDQEYGKLITAYKLDATDMTNLGTTLFLANFWTNLRNKFAGLSDPLSMIISCKELCVDSSLLPTSNRKFCIGGEQVIGIGGVDLQLPALQGRFIKSTLGEIDLKEVFGTSKDYTDVDISIFLPYCGVKQLDPDVVVGTKLNLQVIVDCWNGDILYLLHTDNSGIGGKYYKQETVVYRWTGNCAIEIPLGKVDNTDAIMRVVSSVASIGASAALGYAGGSGAIQGASKLTEMQRIARTNALAVNTGVNAGGDLLSLLSEGFRPTVQTSDGVGGCTGLMDLQNAYLIIKRGVPQYPADFRSQIGAPRYQTFTLSSLTGFTVFSEIHLNNMGYAINEEIEELEKVLTTEGVIL